MNASAPKVPSLLFRGSDYQQKPAQCRAKAGLQPAAGSGSKKFGARSRLHMKEEMKIASSSRFQEIQSLRNALNISSDARNPPLTLCQQKAEHEDIDEAVLAKSQPKLQCNLQ